MPMQSPMRRDSKSIPGVGPVTALMFLAVLDGAKRFDNAHSVMSYMGLVPREFSSGRKATKRTHHQSGCLAEARSLLVQAAHHDEGEEAADRGASQKWAEGISQRRGKANCGGGAGETTLRNYPVGHVKRWNGVCTEVSQ